MKQVDFSLGLKWNEKQMSWRVTESVCVLSARPMWVMALIWPPAPQLFIILRWQGGAGKRRGLGAPSWSITLEVSFPSYLTATWITAALVYRCQPIWMSSRRRKQFLCSLYQSRWVIGRMECATSFSLHSQTCVPTHRNRPTYTQAACAPVRTKKNINGGYSANWNKWKLRGEEAIVDECMAVQHTLEDKLVCGPVYLFSWITFISVIMFFFLGYLSQHVLSVYTSMRADMREKRWSTPVVVSGYSAEVIALQSMISWIESVVPIFTGVFERKTSIKMAIFFHLFHFLLPSLLGYSPCSLAGQNVVVSISNRALMSITSPGVSPKIHTFCQS